MDEEPNPFAAPTTSDTAQVAEAPELHGRMPGSVMLAIGCVGVVVAINALLLFGVVAGGAIGGGVSTVALLSIGLPVVIGLLVLIGLVARNRLAWQWGRIMGCLGALLSTLLIGFAGFGFLMAMNDGVFAELENSPDAPFDRSTMLFFMLLGLGFYALPAVLLWTEFFALGASTARAYFGLFCPVCKSRRVKAKNFLFTSAKCKSCGEVW